MLDGVWKASNLKSVFLIAFLFLSRERKSCKNCKVNSLVSSFRHLQCSVYFWLSSDEYFILRGEDSVRRPSLWLKAFAADRLLCISHPAKTRQQEGEDDLQTSSCRSAKRKNGFKPRTDTFVCMRAAGAATAPEVLDSGSALSVSSVGDRSRTPICDGFRRRFAHLLVIIHLRPVRVRRSLWSSGQMAAASTVTWK